MAATWGEKVFDWIWLVCVECYGWYPYGCFQNIGVPRNGWFRMENPIKMDDLGAHYFRKHPWSLEGILGSLGCRYYVLIWYRCEKRCGKMQLTLLRRCWNHPLIRSLSSRDIQVYSCQAVYLTTFPKPPWHPLPFPNRSTDKSVGRISTLTWRRLKKWHLPWSGNQDFREDLRFFLTGRHPRW